jgi:hypothetical protein
MQRRLQLSGTILVLVSLACARASSPNPRPAPRSRPDLDSVAAALAASGDSIHLGDTIAAACTGVRDNSECIEKPLSDAAARGHVKVAMGALNRLGAQDPEIRRTGHVYAHAIGIAAGSARRDIAQTFTQCSESYQSGCYHGVIQAWFASMDSVSASDANALCAPFRNRESDRWIRFQCVHGMGHGLTMLYDHNLPKGLAGCDLLTEWWDRHSCYSGAFMENIVNVTMPHHPASALAHHEGKGGDHSQMAGMDHDMAGMDHGSIAAFKPVDPDDELYPCSALSEKYLSACYEMQTSVMLYNNKGDIAGAARACDTAPIAMRPICYASLGRDVSSYSQQNHAEAIRMCSLGTARYRPWCYYGLAKNFIDLEARPHDGMALCRDVPDAAGKMLCYDAVGEQTIVLETDPERRKAICQTAEPDFVAVCSYGARLSVQAPRELLALWEEARK